MQRALIIAVFIACALAWAAAPAMTNLNPTARPSARTGPGVAAGTFPDAGEVEVLFGGNALLSTNNQTWTYTRAANTWSQRTTTGTPTARAWHSVSWDEGQRRLVLFGGSAALNGPLRNDTYTFDPTTDTWKALTNSGTTPSARFLSHLFYVPSLNAHLLYAGATGTSSNAEATALDTGLYRVVIDDAAATATWTTLAPSGTIPPGRSSACFGFDRARQRLVVFGGEVVNDTLGDTWEYDVVTNAWIDPMATGSPTKRGSSVCTFDQRTGKLMMYGGVGQPSGTPIGEAWEYNPTLRRWRQLAPSPNPGNLTFAGSTFSPSYGGMFFFGGRISAISTSQATWTFVGNGTPSIALMNQTVDESQLVTMAAALTDVDTADPNTWTWAQDAGPSVTLTGPTTSSASFTAPRVTAQTVFRFTVSVNDGAETATTFADITVRDDLNEPPVVDAGPGGTLNEAAMTTLTSVTVEPNGEAVTRAWTQVSGPAVTFGTPTAATTTVTAPRVTSGSTVVVRFTATDTRAGTGTKEVTLTIPDSINEPPIADAGPNVSVVGGTVVDVVGSGSDPNGEMLTGLWSVVDGGALALIPTGPSVRATTPLDGGAWVLEWTVTDTRGGTASDQMVLTATPFDAGIPDAGVLPLDGGGVSDAGNDAGTSADGGLGFDGGAVLDAGPSPDAGTSSDAGADLDAGTSPDAGADLDAGNELDAGSTTDAGATDGGATNDGGLDGTDAGPPERRTYSLGCGCTSDSGALAALLGLLALGRRRRPTAK